MKKRCCFPDLLLCLCFCLCCFTLIGCGKKVVQRPAPAAPVVVVDKVVEKEIQLHINTTGHTEASQYVSVPARVVGFLQAIQFVPGEMVKEGQPLFLIEQADYIAALNSEEAQLKVNEAKAMLDKANLDRNQQLRESKTISEEEYQSTLADYQIALAQIDVSKAAIDRAKLNLSYTQINSPIGGKTGPNLVDQGNLVGPGSEKIVLATVAKLDPLFVYFDVSDADFNAFMLEYQKNKEEAKQRGEPIAEDEKEMHAPFSITILSSTSVIGEVQNTYNGTIKLVDNTIDRSTGTITLRGEVPNPDFLIFPGQICRVQIPYGKGGKAAKEQSILIREEAINSDLNTKYVLLVDKDNIVRRRNIKIGPLLDDRMRVVLSGLKPGETYIYEGIQRARIDDPVKPMSGEEYEKMTGQ
ncbi:MAG: efflux RND transporter periplasmic adaptor subunit [Thermoguttaceae bacterium]